MDLLNLLPEFRHPPHYHPFPVLWHAEELDLPPLHDSLGRSLDPANLDLFLAKADPLAHFNHHMLHHNVHLVEVLHVLENVEDLGGHHLYLDALVGFLLEEGLELFRDSSALAVLNHVAERGKLGLRHDAVAGRLVLGN